MWTPEHRRPRSRSTWPSLSERPHRRRMGVDGADDPAGAARRAAAQCECTRGVECNPLRARHRLPVEGAAEGPAAEEHSALLFHAVGLGRHS